MQSRCRLLWPSRIPYRGSATRFPSGDVPVETIIPIQPAPCRRGRPVINRQPACLTVCARSNYRAHIVRQADSLWSPPAQVTVYVCQRLCLALAALSAGFCVLLGIALVAAALLAGANVLLVAAAATVGVLVCTCRTLVCASAVLLRP